MASSTLPLLCVLLLLALFPSPSRSASLSLLTASSNTSTYTSTFTDSDPIPAPDPTFLEEVIDAVTEKYDWDPDAEVRVWPLDADSARVGAVQRYEFRARAGSSAALARLSDVSVEWRRPDAAVVEEVDGPDGLDVVAGDGAVGFGPGVRDVDLVGPVEVWVASGLGELQLPSELGDAVWRRYEPAVNTIVLTSKDGFMIPMLNATYAGLKRVLVAAGIALKITRAHRVSFTHPHSIGLLANGSLLASNKDLSHILPLSHPTCAPLLHVNVVGSVIIIAHETYASGGHVKPLLRSDDSLELLSDKWEVHMSDRLISECVFCSISPRLKRLEETLRTWFSKRNEFNRSMNFIEAKVTSIALVKFQLELERDITEEDGIWENIPEWKTLPVVQRVSLDIVARVEEEGRLKAISVKKVRKPFPIVDATSWSSLTSNVSFADFMSFVLPPDPLSLDVKW